MSSAHLLARQRELALGRVRSVMQRFTFDLARIMAGHDVDFGDGVSRDVATRIHGALAPLLQADLRLAPDFGQFAELRVYGDLARGAQVRCALRFTDQSALEDSSGNRLEQFSRVVDVHATLTLQPCRIVACSFAVEHAT